jgi:transcriptional regulator with PAS, ATPase and Fis domain
VGQVVSVGERVSWDRIIGNSPALRSVKGLLERIAAIPVSTVLLIGESGTGKDLMAKAIHDNGVRAPRRFQNVTCSALPETLLESELFGHDRGAFTDAKRQKKGLLELADGGTVFLDEIGETKPSLQVKLLRFLEERAFRRLGGSIDIRVDVRIIAATNRNLKEAMQEGSFRRDFYYRLRVLPVRIPPLRERSGDLPLLVESFIRTFNAIFHKEVRGISPEALAQLESYRWPGNVRELKNVVERAMLLTEGNLLTPADFLKLEDDSGAGLRVLLPSRGLIFSELERNLLTQAIERAGGNQTRAGQLLGWSRDQIRYRMAKFGLLTTVPVEPVRNSSQPLGKTTH